LRVRIGIKKKGIPVIQEETDISGEGELTNAIVALIHRFRLEHPNVEFWNTEIALDQVD